MEKLAALLPIKQHSERVPGKNFRLLCGKPLYQWILETLISCKSIDAVVIDTDDEGFIQTLNRDWPMVKTLLRPPAIRGGAVSMDRVIEHDMSQLPEYDYFLQTHTTNPLLTAASIDGAVKAFFERAAGYDSLFSVNRIQARTYWGNGSPINHTLGELKRTQDLEPIYEENSNFFIFSRDSFAATGSRLGKRPLLFETPAMESLEIDEESDFQFVQLVLTGMGGQTGQ